MSRTSSDTHTALLLNRLTNYLAGAFVFLLLITILFVYGVTYSIQRDCNNPYGRNLKLFGWWITIHAGSTKQDCVQP
jgi:hypothetical protein